MSSASKPLQSPAASSVEISADHGATAIGRVGQLNMAGSSSPTVVGTVEHLNVFVPIADAPKATTSVVAIGAMRAPGSTFVGRHHQLDALAQFLTASGADSRSVALVTGPPGVGKTALVWQAVTDPDVESRFSHRLFADLRGYEEFASERVQAPELYGSLLRGLEVPVDQIPDRTSDQASLYHRVLEERAAAGRAVLIWLDNVGDQGQIDGLIPASSLHRVISTTRGTFPRDLNRRLDIDLDLLVIDEAVELLARAIQIGADSRVDDDRQATELLAELCDRLPLALQIIAALIADEPSRPIRAFAAELQEEEHRLDNLHYDDRLSVRAALSLSYKRLPEQLQRLFRLMSQVPGGDVSLDAARWLIDVSASAMRPQLMALVRSHLVQQHVTDRWSMHDLVRLYAAERAAADRVDADRALRDVVEKYRLGVTMAGEWLTAVASNESRTVFDSPAKAARWFERERSTLMSIVRHIAGRAGYDEICLHLGVVLGDLLRSQAHWRTDFYDIAAITASLVARVDPMPVAASALSNYGTALGFQQEYRQAQDYFERAVEMFEDVGAQDRASNVRSNIGNLLQSQGKFDDAIAIYRADLEQCPPETHPHPAAGTLSNLGGVLVKVGRPGEAVIELSKAVKLCRRLDGRPGLASSLLNLGGAYLELSTHQDTTYARKAVDAFQESLDISRAQHNTQGTFNAMNNLGAAQCSLQRFEPGIQNLENALHYFEHSGQLEQADRTRRQIQQERRTVALLNSIRRPR